MASSVSRGKRGSASSSTTVKFGFLVVSELRVMSCLPVCLGDLSCFLSPCPHIELLVWIFSCLGAELCLVSLSTY